MLNPHDWTTLQAHFETLETEPVDALNAAGWLQRWSDLERALYEAFSRAYRAKQEDTTSQSAEDAYLNLVENVVPHVKVAQNRLEQKLAALPESALPEDALELLKRTRASLEIFREANVALETELSKLGVEYDKIVGDFSIDLNGEELTLYGALAKLQEPDRDVRETVYRALVNRWRQDREKLEALFMQMLRLRRQVAENAGFADYRAFIWKAKARFDYTPEDCLTLHDSILEHIVPVLRSEMDTHRASLGLEALKPWDVDVDSANRVPLKPFSSIHELEAICRDVFAKLDLTLARCSARSCRATWTSSRARARDPAGTAIFTRRAARPTSS
ncbi:MAG: M3 family oligoendopeptidase [Pleurocapsa sp. SU_196_0]|nr:M3 family oligoendopeptidase [Pleurocapsa sp. SU_196_0]